MKKRGGKTKPWARAAAAVLAAAIVLVTLLSSVTQAGADTVITFTNERIESPNLYVTKTVQVTEGDTADYSDVEFTFTLYLDGSVARNLEYFVYDENGNRVYLYEDGESTEVKSNAQSYYTSRQGQFTLKAGQMAVFEDVGSGVTYKVIEEETEGFTQILPSGGAAAEGTLGSYGATAAFTNLAEAETGKSGFIVYKTASFPSGWTLPEETEFSFTLEISGDAFALEEYTVYSQSDGGELRTDYTDADGNFTLAAGEYAVFETDADVDYKVTENATDGWRTTTEDTFEGSTGDTAQTVVFNNALASFIVTKEAEDLEGNSPDDEFTFILKNGSGNLWSGVTYCLYDIYGNPQYDGNGDPITGTTDNNGEFSLASGQAAVFIGIASGTVYSVMEKAVNNYTQTVPEDPNGYANKEVTDAIEVLPFENEEIDLTGTLSVTKTLSAASGSLPANDEDFTFYLKDANGDPVSGAVYSITQGSDRYTYKTGADGSLALKAGQTAVFSSLTQGDYTISEDTSWFGTEDDQEWYEFGSVTVDDENGSTDYSDNGDTPVSLGEGGASCIYENYYCVSKCSITVIKETSDGKRAEGVTFALYDPDGNLVSEETTDPDGTVYWEGLTAGTYRLTETDAPEGYTLLLDAVSITVPYVVTEQYADENGIDTSKASWHSADSSWYWYDVTYTVTDTAVITLPKTGAAGNVLGILCALGIFCIITAYVRLACRRSTERKRRTAGE